MSPPLVGPDQPLQLADITREAYIYFGAGATVAWQMANPGVGHGVAEHSRTLEQPLSRLRATMDYIYAVTLGSDAERAAIRRRVDQAHAPVRSPRYSAFDPHLQLWVAATLYRGAEDLYRLFVGPLSRQQRALIYRQAWAYGRTLQVDDAQWPADVAAFDTWWDTQVAQLRVDAPVRDYMQAVLRGGRAPWYARAGLPLQRFVTRGLLPPDLRAAFGLPWSRRDAARWRRFSRWAPRLYWHLPAWLRHLPARHHLHALRRTLAAR